MKYLNRSFTVKMGENEAFRSNYDRIFPKTPSEPVLVEPLPDPLGRSISDRGSTDCAFLLPENGLKAVLIHLPLDDYKILSAWATNKNASEPLDPDVAHTVLMAVADAVSSP